ncbi:MAG: undecaprenyl-diphosphate phosphatase [Gammaproteobacteria bacterium]|nr:MAG: undecaprenyl-diphosphate phosphatase [Gammaproteobacteria bacterium]
MIIWHILVLAILQGLTEFLPISSSAHLILLPELSDWPDQGLSFDIAVHVGTLMAVMIYFRQSLLSMGRDWGKSLAGGPQTQDCQLAWKLIYATIPVVIVGWLLKDYVGSVLRDPLVIASASIVFGLLLWVSDRQQGKVDEYSLSWQFAIVIGLLQAIALIPGTSRSGITITGGLLLGMSREAAARFSFLLSIPTIAAAGILNVVLLLQLERQVDWLTLFLGAIFAGISAYICIHFFLKFISRIGMLPFVIYRVLLGAALLAFFL